MQLQDLSPCSNAVRFRRLCWSQGLTLLDHLVKLGAERVVDDAREHLFRIQVLQDFTYQDEEGVDRGQGSKLADVSAMASRT